MFLSVRSFNNPHYIEQYFVRLRANKKLLFYYIYNIIYKYINIYIYIIKKKWITNLANLTSSSAKTPYYSSSSPICYF